MALWDCQQIFCRAEGIISFLENMICLFYKHKYTVALPFKKSSLSPPNLILDAPAILKSHFEIRIKWTPQCPLRAYTTTRKNENIACGIIFHSFFTVNRNNKEQEITHSWLIFSELAALYTSCLFQFQSACSISHPLSAPLFFPDDDIINSNLELRSKFHLLFLGKWQHTFLQWHKLMCSNRHRTIQWRSEKLFRQQRKLKKQNHTYVYTKNIPHFTTWH